MVDAYLRAGRLDDARQLADEAIAMGATRYVQPTLIALFHAAAGRLDEGFAALARAEREHDLLPVMNYFPTVTPLKRDPRWAATLRRIGVEPAPR
jgi:pentatricopeptide repeat protein